MKRLGILLTLVALALAACAPQPTEPTPPAIHYGQDVCDACGMLVDDPHFAAATVLENGDFHKFDDIAEMVGYHMDHPNEVVKAWFVQDYNSQTPIRAETAFFVQADNLHSPMEHNIAAFADQAAANAFATEHGGTVLNFDSMRAAAHMLIHG